MTANQLTPERLFSDPPLSGGAPTNLKFSPDGTFLTYLRAAADDRERMDLWQVTLNDAHHSVLLDARTLSDTHASATKLTAAERAERERRRQFSHGITQYSWHPNGDHLLVPIDGQALLVDMSDPNHPCQAICPDNTRQSGFQLSPQGTYLSYVRAGDLYITNLGQGLESRLTDDASETITNGLPDFLAAEEMHRFRGHWWSADEEYVFFCKVDEAPVAVSHRLEMEADGARTIEQRYPYAGATNPHVELWLYHTNSCKIQRLWQNSDTDAYLARVHTGFGELVIQTQDRLQQRLSIQRYDIDNDLWQPVYTETSASWINLTDDLRLLDNQHILLSTEQAGTRTLMIVDADGNVKPLAGPTHINDIVGMNTDTVYVTGWDDTPIENHLFAIDLTGGQPRKLTMKAGWHDIVINTQATRFLDRFTSDQDPLQISIYDLTNKSPLGEQDTTEIYAESIVSPHPYSAFIDSHSMSEFGELRAADGQRLCYRLTPPARISGQHGTIVYVYGGPGPQKVRREWSPLTVQLFAQNGFAVLELDNRGTGNRGREFEAPIYKQWGQIEVADQILALQALDAHAWADKSRVGIFGHSYGGYMTLMCLSQASAHFSAGVAVAPVSDWRLYDSHYTERYMGLPNENPEGYTQANVLTHLDQLNAPLLLMHGMADDNVLFTHSTLVMAELQRLGKPFELMTYPGAKHSMQERDVSIHRFNMILDFFSRHIGARN